MRKAILLLFSVIVALSAQAWDRPTPGKPSRQGRRQAAEQVFPAALDTVASPDSVKVAGFEKQLRSTRESMFVTNHTARPIEWMELEVAYLDMKDRMLHKATHEVEVEIPAGETRMIDIPTFDRQQLFYYYKTGVSSRAKQATPFKVAVKVRRVCHPVNDLKE